MGAMPPLLAGRQRSGGAWRGGALALLALGTVAVLLSWRPEAAAPAGLLLRPSNAYMTDGEAHSDLSSYFDKLSQATSRTAQQSARASNLAVAKGAEASEPAHEAAAGAQKDTHSLDARLERAEDKVKMLKKQKELQAINEKLSSEKSKVDALQEKRESLKHQIAGGNVQSLRVRVYPPGGGATSYAKSIKTVETKSTECLPPKVMFDGKCQNYLQLKADQKKQARQLLRKNAYYKYKWAFQNRKSGYKHHFRVVPKRYPHEDGADLGDNYVGLDCGKPGCRYKVLEDKMKSGDDTYPKARIPRLFRPFTGDSLDLRFPKRPQKLKPGIAEANAGVIDKAVGRFFKSQKLGYQQYMEQFHPWDHVVRKPSRVDRFRPLSSSLYRRKNYPKGGGASRGNGGWKTPTYSSAVGGKVLTLHSSSPRQVPLPYPVQGPKTAAEKALLDGSDPLQSAGLFDDEELPASNVLSDKAQDAYKHKAEGEPLTDAGLNNWDMMNGVADP